MKLKNNFFIITGAPGSGKSTIINELSNLGYPCFMEPARAILAEQRTIGGEGIPERNPSRFTELFLERTIENFKDVNEIDKVVFFDRGVPDAICYASLFDLELEKYKKSAIYFRYNPIVFFAPPWERIYQTEDERKMVFDAARIWSSTFKDVYTELGYTLIELPTETTVQERVRFILDRVARKNLDEYTLTLK
jgi:predicted ATPase